MIQVLHRQYSSKALRAAFWTAIGCFVVALAFDAVAVTRGDEPSPWFLGYIGALTAYLIGWGLTARWRRRRLERLFRRCIDVNRALLGDRPGEPAPRSGPT